MSQRYSKMKLYMTDKNNQMRSKLMMSEKDKPRENVKYFSARNDEGIIRFPNIIETFSKFNESKHIYQVKTRNNTNKNNKYITINPSRNEETFSNIDKNLNSEEKFKNQFTETEFDSPKLSSKYNMGNRLSSNSFKKNKKVYNTITYNNNIDNMKKSSFVLSSMKRPNFSNININNISNINNIYNKKDYIKYAFSQLNDINNNNKRVITINYKKTETDLNSNEDDDDYCNKDNILNLLNKKSMSFNPRIKRVKKIKRKDEFKEFLKDVLKQYKNKNTNKVKRKININCLLNNIKIKNNNNSKSNEPDNDNKELKEKKNAEINSGILKNEYLNSKLNKKKKLKEIVNKNKLNKKNIFNIYKFNKNKILIDEIEDKLLKFEKKLKKDFSKYKQSIDNAEQVIS